LSTSYDSNYFKAKNKKLQKIEFIIQTCVKIKITFFNFFSPKFLGKLEKIKDFLLKIKKQIYGTFVE